VEASLSATLFANTCAEMNRFGLFGLFGLFATSDFQSRA